MAMGLSGTEIYAVIVEFVFDLRTISTSRGRTRNYVTMSPTDAGCGNSTVDTLQFLMMMGDPEMKPEAHYVEGTCVKLVRGFPQISKKFPRLKLDRDSPKRQDPLGLAKRLPAASVSPCFECYAVTCPDNGCCGTSRRLIAIRE